jgi:hypothetical protein
MKEIPYLYQIIRYVPDLERMEPQNIGIILQGPFNVVSKVWTHFRPLGEKPDFDYANFRKWREFFDDEEKVHTSRLNAQLIVVMDEINAPSEEAQDSTKHLYDNYIRGKEELKSLSDEVISSAQQSEGLVSRIEEDLKELHA